MLIYGLFAWINSGIYSLLSIFFKVIMYLADVKVFGDSDIAAFRDRIYMLLAIIMFFKIAISTIQYIVNPEELGNSDKGVGAILKNSAIAIIMLVVVPEVFKFARAAQSDISSYIPSIILGEDNNIVATCNQSGKYNKISCQADQMSMAVLNVFVVNTKNSKAASFTSLDEFREHVGDHCDACKLLDPMKCFIAYNCDYNFHILLATAVGILMVYIIISMGVDVAIRVFKLTILEMMAPIPIVTFIDKGKGGAFEAWLKECKDVYLDLFVRLIVIYFIVYAIGLLTSRFWSFGELFGGELQNEDIFTKGLVLAFLIIGLLLFAKDAPKFICDLLGLKGADKISGMFKRAAGLMGTSVAGIRTARSNYRTQKERQIGKGKNARQATIEALKSAAAGFASATGRGMVATGQGKGFKEARSQAFKDAIAARNRRNDRVDNLYSKVDEMGNKISRWTKDASGKKVKNPEYYGYREYKADVAREKLGIPTGTAFVKVKFDAADALAKSTADEKAFGATKMNENPTSANLRSKFKFSDGVERVIGLAEARAYGNIQIGTTTRDWTGKEVVWDKKHAEEAQQLVQEIEKRASYLRVGELIAKNDPTSKQNRDKTVLEIVNNKTALDRDTLKTVYAAIATQLIKNGTAKNEQEAKEILFGITDPAVLATKTEEDFDANRLISLMRDDVEDRPESIAKFADILAGAKQGFEDARQAKYTEAQRADARTKKAQEAINSDKSSGGGK